MGFYEPCTLRYEFCCEYGANYVEIMRGDNGAHRETCHFYTQNRQVEDMPDGQGHGRYWGSDSDGPDHV